MDRKDRNFILLVFSIKLGLLIRIEILLPDYIKSLGGNLAFLGLFLSLQQTISLIMRLPSGYYADILNKKLFILISNLIKSVASIILGFSTQIYHIALAIFFRGFGIGLGHSSYLVLVGETSREKRVGLTYGIERSIGMLFLMLGSLITGKMADIFGLRAPILLGSIFFLVGFLIIYKFVDLSSQPSNVQFKNKMIKQSLKKILGDRNLLIFSLAFFFLFIMESCFIPFFVVYIQNSINISYYDIGIIIGLGNLFGFFSNIYTGFLVDRIGCKKILILTGLFRTFTCFLIPFSNTFFQLVIIYLIRGIFWAGPPRHAMITKISPKHFRAMMFSIVGVALDLGMVIGSLLLGIIAETVSLNSAFFIMAISTAFYTILILLFFRKKKED